MTVKVEVDQLAKGLNARDHARKDIIASQNVAVDVDNGFPGGASKIAQQRAVEPEVEAKPLGDRKDKLSMRHGRADASGNRVG